MFKNFFKGIHILSNQMQYIRYFKPNSNYLTLWDLNKNNNYFNKHTFSNELQKLKKGNNFTTDNNMNNHNYSIKAIVDNYNERWNTNLTIEEYLKHFTRKHRGAC